MRLESLSFINHSISNNCELILSFTNIFFLLECIILQYFVKSYFIYFSPFTSGFFFFYSKTCFFLLYLRSKYSWSNSEKCRNRTDDKLILPRRLKFRLSDPEAMQNGSRFICVFIRFCTSLPPSQMILHVVGHNLHVW